MMSSAISYTQTGRKAQKARTEAAMIAAARDLLAEGVMPTVEQAAARAGVSRATAYRYFVNQRLLVAAVLPEIDDASLLPDDAPEDPVERATLVASEIMRMTLDNETELRAMLRVSLEPHDDEPDLPLRKGRRIRWFEDALSPLRPVLGRQRHGQLVLANAAAVGIEALVWLTDVAGMSRRDAAELLVSTARSLTRDAINER